MPNSKLYNVKTTLTDGTIIDSGTSIVPQGERGYDGTNALETYYSYTGTTTPEVGNEININVSNFNRHPIDGDSCFMQWKNTSDGKSYSVGIWCSIGASSGNATFLIQTVTETTGAQGPAGESEQLYRHNITIKTKIGDAIYNLTVINKSSTAFTYTSFAQFLQTLGLTSDFVQYECSGAKGSSSGIAIGIYVGLNYILQVKYVIPSASFNYDTAALNADDIFFYDMVKEV